MVDKIFKCMLAFFCLLFVSCSAGRDEGKVCIKLPSRAELARAGTDGNIVNIFVTGDYEAKKTVPFDEDNDQTVTFDSIPAGASVGNSV